MRKLLFFNPGKDRLPYIDARSRERGVGVDVIEESLSLENVDLLKDYDGLVAGGISPYEPEVYESLEKVGMKQISLQSVGFDHIDLQKASSCNLIVTNVSDYSPESIAEFTVMMVLKLFKRDSLIREKVEAQDFSQQSDLIGQSLRGKTCGVVGLGRIGTLTGKYLQAFGMEILVYTPHPREGLNFSYATSLYDLAEKSDVICLHSRLTEDNFHMIGEDFFSRTKPSAFLVNTARGELVDTKALLKALDEGKLAGAALDVIEEEGGRIFRDRRGEDIKDPIFERILHQPKIDYYPHLSFYTDISIKNGVYYALDAALEVIETGDSPRRVN